MKAVAFPRWPCWEPDYKQEPFVASSLRSHVAVGTFVRFGGDVARIVSCEGNSLLLNTFVKFSESNLKTRGPITHSGCYQEEVVQTKEGILVEMSEIKRIAFVLSPQQLEEAQYAFGDGVGDVFVCCYRSNNTETPTTFYPFLDKHPGYPLIEASYAYEVFKDLIRIEDLASVILNVSAEAQGTLFTERGACAIHPPTVDYLKIRFGLKRAELVKTKVRRKRTAVGLATTTYSEEKNFDYFRFETESDMTQLMDVLGPSAVMGNQAKRPRVGAPTVPRTGSVVNVVEGCDDEDKQDFKRRTTARGFDMAMDSDLCRLYLRYQRHVIGGFDINPSKYFEMVYNYQLGSQHSQSGTSTATLHYNVLVLGAEFKHERGAVYKVIRIESDHIIAVPFGEEDEDVAILFDGETEMQTLESRIKLYNM